MKKKVLATLLAAAMTAGALAGCGGNAAETPAQQPAAETPAAETPATEEAPAAEVASAPEGAIETLIANTTGPVDMTV